MAEAVAEEAEQPKKPRAKRQKKHHGGHHGGAWKVAFADFITTMMALFLLLWLLNSTDAQTQSQLAQYFRDPGVFETQRSNLLVPPLKIDGVETKNDGEPGPPKPDTATSGQSGKDRQGDKGSDKEKESQKSGQDDVKIDSLTAKIDMMLKTGDGALSGYIVVTRTPKGMRITALNGPDNRMFYKNTARPTPELQAFLVEIGEGLSLIREAQLTIKGHTDATPLARPDGYGNFDLSVDRASTVKRLLQSSGVPEQRFVAIEGHGPTMPTVDDPLDARNQRVTIDVEWMGNGQ